jgi:stage V sporulation protein R
MGLAHEILINSSPCISYLMEENTATMQTRVIAHAAFGHHHFFKNNSFSSNGRMPRAFSIISISRRATWRNARNGTACYRSSRRSMRRMPLMSHGIDRHPGKKKLDLRAEEKRAGERRLREESAFNDLWRTIPTGLAKSAALLSAERRRNLLGLPQENLLYFLEKTAPRLQPWQRDAALLAWVSGNTGSIPSCNIISTPLPSS